MNKYAIIAAGGSGTRMGSPIPKQFLELHGKPLVWHTITAFLQSFDDLEIILVLQENFIALGQQIIQSTGSAGRIQIVTGGKTRFHSVKNGLSLVLKPSTVFVHDGVRCLVSTDLIRRCYEVAQEKGNAIPAVTAADSFRIETTKGYEVIDRNKIRIIQTPQTFLSDVVKKAFEQQYDEAFTDEASVVEKCGAEIALIEGEITNIKITSPIDMLIAEKILDERRKER